MYEPDEATARWAASVVDIDRDEYCLQLGRAIILFNYVEPEEPCDWLQLP